MTEEVRGLETIWYIEEEATRYLEAFSSKDSTAMKGGIREDHPGRQRPAQGKGVSYRQCCPEWSELPENTPNRKLNQLEM